MRRVVFVLLLAVAVGPEAPAHPGGLDARGGHRDHRRGGYHCHRCLPAYVPGALPEPEPAPPTPKGARSGCYYFVAAGDTLKVIGDYFGWSVSELVALNPGLHPDHLGVGQRLRTPGTCNTDAPTIVSVDPSPYAAADRSHEGCGLVLLALAALSAALLAAWWADDRAAVFAAIVKVERAITPRRPKPSPRHPPARPDDVVYVRGHHRRRPRRLRLDDPDVIDVYPDDDTTDG